MLDPRTISFEPSFMHSCMIRKLASGELVAVVGGMHTYLLTDPDLELALRMHDLELRQAAAINRAILEHQQAQPKKLKRSLDDLELDI